MKKNFDPKIYQEKPRIYRPVVDAPCILRVYVWNDIKREYQASSYEARRWEQTGNGKPVRKKRSFEDLNEARRWQHGLTEEPTGAAQAPPRGPRFGDLIEEWKKRHFPSIQLSTQLQYEKLINLYMKSLMSLTVHEITSKRVDQWIDELKDPNGLSMQSSQRKSFSHELNCLITILNYYVEYYDDDEEFRFPIKARHREAVELNRPAKPKLKDIREDEFNRFLEELAKGNQGRMFATLAKVQFYQALRISEAAALHWEDVKLNPQFPTESYLRVTKKVEWIRKAGFQPEIKEGFKNAKANEGVKSLPMFRRTFEALSEFHSEGVKGLIFQIDGQPLSYRQIQYAYDKAFKRAGLPYSATHVMRHGGCQLHYNKNGDLAVAQQVLGNADLKSTLVYAKRDKRALLKLVEAEWEEPPKVVASGRKDDKTA